MPARLSLSTPTSLDFSIYFLLRRRAEVCSCRRACSALLYCVPRGGCMVGATLVAGHYCVLRDSTAAAWLQWSELARWRGGCLARALLYCVPRGGCMVGATLVAGYYCALRDSTAAAWLQWSELARWRGGCLARALPLCTLRRGREPPRNATQQSIKWEETSCSLAESCVALRGCLPPSAVRLGLGWVPSNRTRIGNCLY